MRSIDLQKLKQMNKSELEELAQEIREFIIDKVSQTGGHLGSNLGIVELTIALHHFFDSPNDKFIFDVGHQGYVHKILTGRAQEFDTLRQFKGLSGFLKRSESPHDVWEAGHAATSISGAAGYAYARDLSGQTNEVICIIGDGSLTNGMAIEALNHISELKTKVIIIINDNEMSISRNIGFVDRLLKDLQKSQNYYSMKNIVHKKLRRKNTRVGTKIDSAISAIKYRVKQEISEPQAFFGTMGYKYYGPVDGHNFSELFKVFLCAKNLPHSSIIHVKTIKGLGYEPARINSWHGVAKFDVHTARPINIKKGSSYSKVCAKTLEQMMQKNENIVVVTPAMIDGSELNELNKKFEKRVTDVGIAEEHALTFCAGLALANKLPFLAIYSTFLQRGYDQLFHDAVRQNTKMVIGIDRAGLVGEDGETHQGIYDLSFLTHMPNIKIMMGKNNYELQQLLKLSFELEGVSCVRYPRGGNFEKIYDLENLEPIEFATWDIIKEGKCYIITYGEEVQVFEKLIQNTKIGLINARFIKPLDEKVLQQIKSKKLYVYEQHCSIGNLHALICQYYANKQINVKIKAFNLGDKFIEQGSINELKKEHKICEQDVFDRIISENTN